MNKSFSLNSPLLKENFKGEFKYDEDSDDVIEIIDGGYSEVSSDEYEEEIENLNRI